MPPSGRSRALIRKKSVVDRRCARERLSGVRDSSMIAVSMPFMSRVIAYP